VEKQRDKQTEIKNPTRATVVSLGKYTTLNTLLIEAYWPIFACSHWAKPEVQKRILKDCQSLTFKAVHPF